MFQTIEGGINVGALVELLDGFAVLFALVVEKLFDESKLVVYGNGFGQIHDLGILELRAQGVVLALF